MPTLEDEILTTFFKDGRTGAEMVPASVIISECTTAGYDSSEVEDAQDHFDRLSKRPPDDGR